MAILPSAVLSAPEHEKPKVVRPSVDYHPSLWGDYFINNSSNQKTLDAWNKRFQELKEEVNEKLRNTNGLVQEWNLIDAIQRLGVGYQFEKEIEESLRRIYNAHNDDIGDDLHAVALQFRLLRQQGYRVSSDVFIKFKDENGHFKESLSNDPRGMLSLYEAAYLSINGDDILEETLAFATDHLKRIKKHLSSFLAKHVGRTLALPLRKSMSRLEARHYISAYQEDKERDDVLLELAKLDFNLLQSVHQSELREITRWWNELDFKTKIPYARSREVECYFWMLGAYHEPKYGQGRLILTKLTIIATLLDDTFDAYGTYEELQRFTDAIQRWDYGAMDQVPEDMRVLFCTIIDVVAGFEEQLKPEGKSYRIYYVKEAVKNLVKAYFVEAKWLHEKYMPTFEEYSRVSAVSAVYPMLILSSFVGLGEEATKEVFDWAISLPKLIYDVSLMSRLMDDMVSYEFEQKRDHIPSSLHVYMNEFGVSKQEAQEKFQEMISDVWKSVNEACLNPTMVPMPIITRVLNFSTAAEVFYQYGDGFTDARFKTKDHITFVLVDPVPL